MARITILAYHSIGASAGRFRLSVDAFRRHMRWVKSHYEIRHLDDVPDLLAGRPGRRIVIVTFDDAMIDFQTSAYPILRELELPATVFVPTAQLGRHNAWDEATEGVPHTDLLTASQVRDLHGEGLARFGSHTARHVRLAASSEDAIRRELTESRQALEEITGAPVTTFAYPYGMPDDYDARSLVLLGEAGYRLACTMHWGTRVSARHLLELPRIELAEEDDEATVRRKIDGWYDWLRMKQTLGARVRRWRGSAPGRSAPEQGPV